MENELKRNKMGTEPVLKLIFTMSLPTMFSMLIQALYNVVDSIFVARVGDNALTAVSLAFPLQMLLIAVGIGSAVGVNSLISRLLGQGEKKQASDVAAHGIIIAFAAWVIFLLLGLFAMKPFFGMYTDVEEILNYGVDYGSVVLIFSFGFAFEVMIEKELQATGNMLFPMLFQLVGAVTNLILDPLFIFGIGPFPRLEVKGAAVATVIGQIASMIFAVCVMFIGKHEIHISFKGFRLRAYYLKNIFAVGVPAMIMQSISSFMVLALNGILISLSQAAVSVLGIYYKLQSFVFMPVFGLNQGVMPIIGYNYGARNRKRLLSAMKWALCIATVIMTVGTIVFMAAPKQLLMLFSDSQDILDIGVTALRTISLCFIPAGMSIIFSTVFQAVGKGLSSLLISVLRQLVFILPIAYVLSKFGVDYVWAAFPIAEVFSFIFAAVLIVRLKNKTLSKLD